MLFYKKILNKPTQQVILLLSITALCYFNTLFNDYSFDDQLVTENKYVAQGLKGIPGIWNHSYQQVDSMNVDYRPLSLTLYSVEWMAIGKNPHVDHFINLLCYLLCIFFLYKICISVFKLDKIHTFLPFFIVLLYSIHPSHTEVVASIKNRDEIISFILVLISVLFFNRSFEERSPHKIAGTVALSIFFFYLSMLIKLVSLPFMACMFLWCLYRQYYKRYILFFTYLILSLVLIASHLYAFRNFLFQRVISYYENPLDVHTGIVVQLGLGFNALFFYLKFLLIPFPSRFYYGYNTIPLESIANPLPLLSLVTYLALVVLLIFSILRKRTYSFFLFAFLFCVLFYSNLLTLYTGIVSERSMFQFSFFFISFMVLLLHEWVFKKKNAGKASTQKINPVIYFIALYIAALSFLTIRRNLEWKDSFTLLLHDMPYLKNSSLANLITGYNCYQKSMQLKKEDTAAARKWADLSVFYYQETIRISPEWKKTYYNLGNTYRYILKDLDQAEKNYLVAAEKQPAYKGLSRELASLFFAREKFSNAVPYYEAAAKEEPDDPKLLFYSALNLYNTRNIPAFLQKNSELQQRFPQEQYAYLNYGTYYFNLNQTDSIVSNFEKAIRYGCDNPQVIDYMIRYHTGRNENEKAERYRKLLSSN